MLKNDKYEVLVGLEIHAQLLTKSKAFCPNEVAYGEPANKANSPSRLPKIKEFAETFASMN